MRKLLLLSLVFSLSTPYFSSNGACPRKLETPNWRDASLWERLRKHSLDFFDRHAWDESSGSYASEIGADGSRLSDTRHLIALSRMIYGTAHGGRVERAQKTAAFLLDKMVKVDQDGPYFLPALDPAARGEQLPDVLVVNEQAYGLCGLVALYAVTKNADLGVQIERLYKAFLARFHDPKDGAFFEKWDRTTRKSLPHKSYNSVVYPATSFLMALDEVRPDLGVRPILQDLGRRVVDHLIDRRTGWLVEQFDAKWTPQWDGTWQKVDEGTVSIAGHNLQAAWLLMRLSLHGGDDATRFRGGAEYLITQMLDRGAFDPEYGGLFDCFLREKSKTIWHTNKAWWQQAIAIQTLTLAELIAVGPRDRVRTERDRTLAFYTRYFIDPNGGEWAEVEANGKALPKPKGQLGKSTYHTGELTLFLLNYGRM